MSEPQLLTILTDNHPILKQRAIEIDDLHHNELKELIRNMIHTMYKAPGIGLAAPQIGISKRLIVFYLPKERDDSSDKSGIPLTVLINPGYEPLSDEHVDDYEGCLSVPGFRGKVNRYKKIKYWGHDEKGEYIERVAEGWHARLFQHEYDHLDGILYPELMAKEDQLLTFEEYKVKLGK